LAPIVLTYEMLIDSPQSPDLGLFLWFWSTKFGPAETSDPRRSSLHQLQTELQRDALEQSNRHQDLHLDGAIMTPQANFVERVELNQEVVVRVRTVECEIH
jgi:hypothetical protein